MYYITQNHNLKCFNRQQLCHKLMELIKILIINYLLIHKVLMILLQKIL